MKNDQEKSGLCLECKRLAQGNGGSAGSDSRASLESGQCAAAAFGGRPATHAGSAGALQCNAGHERHRAVRRNEGRGGFATGSRRLSSGGSDEAWRQEARCRCLGERCLFERWSQRAHASAGDCLARLPRHRERKDQVGTWHSAGAATAAAYGWPVAAACHELEAADRRHRLGAGRELTQGQRSLRSHRPQGNSCRGLFLRWLAGTASRGR